MATLMGQPKPQASLSSSLLARKGQARPAMRPQGFSGFGNLADAIDDLGWNDMEGAGSVPAEPPVLREREALKAEIETPRPSPATPAEAKPVEAKPEMSSAALTRIGRNVRARQ